MSTVTISCPVCEAPLLLDDELAGAAVACPECDARLRLPAEVSETAIATVLPSEPKTVHRLDRSGTSLDEDHAPAAGSDAADVEPQEKMRPANLPTHRGNSAKEEARRLATLVNADEADEEAIEEAKHAKTVLPEKRRTVPVPPPGEAPLADAPERGEGATARTTLPVRKKTPPPAEETPANVPIPVRGDVTLAPGTLPKSRNAPPARPQALPREEPTESKPASKGAKPRPIALPDDDDAEKVGHRLGTERRLHFSPKSENVMGDPETGDQWGAENDDGVRTRRLVGVALIVLLLIGGGLAAYFLKGNTAAAQGENDETVTPSNPLENVEAARKVLTRFLTAKNVEDMAKEVRHPEITLPRMRRFYQDIAIQPRTIRTESSEWNETRVGDVEFITSKAELDNFRAASFALEIPDSGDLKLDWESYVNWAEIPWKDFLKTPPDEAVEYRVTAILEPYYNYIATGQELDLLSFKLTDPEDYATCWGYCHKDSTAGQEITFQLRRARQLGRVASNGNPVITPILRLKFPPEGKQSNQVMIEGVIHDAWIVP